MNRRVSTRKAAIELETITYTALGKVETHTDANGNKTTTTYDKRGLQTAQSAPEGANTSQVLDAMGDVVQSTDAQGRVTTTVYDARRRVTKTTNPANEATQCKPSINPALARGAGPEGRRRAYTASSPMFQGSSAS